jgi:hypothetical protein
VVAHTVIDHGTPCLTPSPAAPRAVGAWLGLALAACHPATGTHRPGEDHLAGIELRGNQAIDDATLIDGLALHRAANREHGVDPRGSPSSRARARRWSAST